MSVFRQIRLTGLVLTSKGGKKGKYTQSYLVNWRRWEEMKLLPLSSFGTIARSTKSVFSLSFILLDMRCVFNLMIIALSISLIIALSIIFYGDSNYKSREDSQKNIMIVPSEATVTQVTVPKSGSLSYFHLHISEHFILGSSGFPKEEAAQQ